MDEEQYLNALKHIIENGQKKPSRTNVPTLSVFGVSMRFKLWENGKRILPLLTTKKIFTKSVFQELFWFISGCTDSKVLHNMGSRIWDANGTKEFLSEQGLINREEGDLGPVYGFQWRHFNTPYKDCHTSYTNKGVDQLKNVIDGIKKDPFGRRHIVNAWNPCQLKEMALPPCHLMFQFNVRSDEDDHEKPKYLDCSLYQRSGDFPLGIPFNIASYSLLIHIISFITDLIPGEFVHFIGDAHVYINQIEGCKVQLQRKPTKPPILQFVKMDSVKTIDDFSFENIEIVGYNPQAVIKMPFNV